MGRNVGGGELFAQVSRGDVTDPRGRFLEIGILVIDQRGERLAEPSGGEVEGRAGFFDISLDGRWGGMISGDKVNMRFGACDCGHDGPTIGHDIVRYADLGDGDKITCAGTIDAYVRGVS